MGAGAALERAYGAMAGVVGGLTLALAARRPVPVPVVKEWSARLRAAADVLDKLVEGR